MRSYAFLMSRRCVQRIGLADSNVLVSPSDVEGARQYNSRSAVRYTPVRQGVIRAKTSGHERTNTAIIRPWHESGSVVEQSLS